MSMSKHKFSRNSDGSWSFSDESGSILVNKSESGWEWTRGDERGAGRTLQSVWDDLFAEEAVQEEAVQEEAVQEEAVQEEAVQEEAVVVPKTTQEEKILEKRVVVRAHNGNFYESSHFRTKSTPWFNDYNKFVAYCNSRGLVPVR